MTDLTNYAKDKMLDHLYGVAPFTMPATVYLALFTSPTDDNGGGTELAADGYSRQPVTMGAAFSGLIQNTADVFLAAAEDWPEITHGAIMDAATDGNMLSHTALDEPRTALSGQTLEFLEGNITSTLE